MRHMACGEVWTISPADAQLFSKKAKTNDKAPLCWYSGHSFIPSLYLTENIYCIMSTADVIF